MYCSQSSQNLSCFVVIAILYYDENLFKHLKSWWIDDQYETIDSEQFKNNFLFHVQSHFFFNA